LSGIGPLLGLLVLAYVGSMLVSGRTIRGFGLPSGAEYLVLGVVVGPHALGIFTRSTISAFEPIFVLGASWLALVAGIGYGIVGQRRIHFGRALVGVATALGVAAGVAALLELALHELDVLLPSERRNAALFSGIICSETTRHMVRWVVERYGARGPISDCVADMARASALVPLMGLGWILSSAPHSPLSHFGALERLGVTAGIGVVLGLVALVLLGREFRRDESWGLLLGTSVLGAGLSAKLGLSSMATLFVMGLTVSLLSRHRLEIRFMVQPTEKPVMLPVVLAVGACVTFNVPKLGFIVAAALAARLAVEIARGLVLALVLPAVRPVWAEVALGMTSTGALTLAAAFTLHVRSPGASSDVVLAIAAASVLLGEAVGPALLRRAITQSGEAHAASSDEASPVSVHPPPSSMISDHPEAS
jgi:hypothetical protein